MSSSSVRAATFTSRGEWRMAVLATEDRRQLLNAKGVLPKSDSSAVRSVQPFRHTLQSMAREGRGCGRPFDLIALGCDFETKPLWATRPKDLTPL